MSYSPARIENATPPTPEAEKTATPPKPVPGWFSEMPAKDLAANYRALREARERHNQAPAPAPSTFVQSSLEEKFESARRLYDFPERELEVQHQPSPRVRRPVLTPGVVPAGRKASLPHVPPARKSHLLKYVALASLAIVVGSALGFGIAKRDVIFTYAKGKAQSASVSLPNFTAWSAAPPARPAPVSKKEISMASLDVNDARGTLNSMIPLILHAAPPDEANPIDLKISGLPPSAYLSAGKRSGISDWTVKTSEIAGLKLVVPNADLSKLDLEVAALDEKSGALAAPVKSLSIALDGMPKAVAPGDVAAPGDVVVEPVSAAPDNSGNNFNNGNDYVAKGDALMKSGDIAGARQFYLKANEMGNAKGAYGVARSYDPKVFAELNVQGLQPDAAQAEEWYKKAASAGVIASP